jgi:hypothetical protein
MEPNLFVYIEHAMQEDLVQYSVEEVDGVRMIRVTFPRVLTPSTMPEAYTQYLALWEHEYPTAVLVDMVRLEEMPADAKRALHVLLGRISILENFVASAWMQPKHAGIAAVLMDLLRDAGGQRTIFTSEDDALAYLRDRIAARRLRAE